MNATLLVLTGQTTKRKVAMKLPCVLGRSRQSDVTVAHPLISRRHCELSEAAGLLLIRDLASLNGTMIGGRRITTAPLLPDTEFSLGPLTFRVQYEYHGDLESLPPTCYADETEPAEVAFAKAINGAAENEIAAGAQSAIPKPAEQSDSEIVAIPDFVAWADANPDEIAPEALGEPNLAAQPGWPPVAIDRLPRKPLPAAPDEPPLKRQSPWETEHDH